eukprot:749744-Pleurochrysis_carterae.AAC.2
MIDGIDPIACVAPRSGGRARRSSAWRSSEPFWCAARHSSGPCTRAEAMDSLPRLETDTVMLCRNPGPPSAVDVYVLRITWIGAAAKFGRGYILHLLVDPIPTLIPEATRVSRSALCVLALQDACRKELSSQPPVFDRLLQLLREVRDSVSRCLRGGRVGLPSAYSAAA